MNESRLECSGMELTLLKLLKQGMAPQESRSQKFILILQRGSGFEEAIASN